MTENIQLNEKKIGLKIWDFLDECISLIVLHVRLKPKIMSVLRMILTFLRLAGCGGHL